MLCGYSMETLLTSNDNVIKLTKRTLLTTKKSSYTIPLGSAMPPALVTASGRTACTSCAMIPVSPSFRDKPNNDENSGL